MGLVILVGLLKKISDLIFPETAVFIHNLLSGIQVLILLFTILLLVSGGVTTRKSNLKRLAFLLLITALPELVFTYLLHHPSQIPDFCVPAFRNYYDGVQRNIIQFNPSCSVYDSSLFYSMKPSTSFIFSNYEFADGFHTNRLGLRDDDNSLLKPDIICLGDSYALGWGVEQNETFAEELSRGSGKKVLNAAVSSYGTARELKNLYRLDTSNLQYIVIQYCRNDLTENKQFADDGYSLKISSEKKYDSSVTAHYWNRLWFPGKHFITMSRLCVSNKLAGIQRSKKLPPADSSELQLKESARYFADILLHAGINFNKTKVYVVDLDEKESMNNDFVNEMTSLISLPVYEEHFNHNLIMVPVADLLDNNDYYILDPHLRASGHRKIAQRLIQYMFTEKQRKKIN